MKLEFIINIFPRRIQVIADGAHLYDGEDMGQAREIESKFFRRLCNRVKGIVFEESHTK